MLTPLADAQQIILDAVSVLGCEKVGLLDVRGRVLAEEIRAERDHPPWDNSSMDGFAGRAADIQAASALTPAVLKVIEAIAAGTMPTRVVGQGEAARIMTGAPLPAGADTVVKVEDTESTVDTVKIFLGTEKGANIRRRGEDLRQGDRLISVGTIIRPAEVAMLAALGKPLVSVFQRARVAILATGDELVDLGEPLTEEKIANANSYGIAAAVQEAGGIPLLLGIAKDRPEDLKAKIRQGLSADLLILSGGVSVGEYDFTKPVFQELGGEMRFWKLAIRPGQPVAFGRIGKTLAFGLPGNPVSALVTFEVLVRPALLKMSGHEGLTRPVVRAVFQDRFAKPTDRRYFLRGVLWREQGMVMVRLTGNQGSGILTSMVKANGLIDVPAEVAALKPGDVVDVRVLGHGF